MKIDRRNPIHWLRLLGFATSILLASLARPFRRKNGRKRILFYGHRLAGNLWPVYTRLRERYPNAVEVGFISMDPCYRQALSLLGESPIAATSLRAIDWLSTVDAVVSDHGLHAMQPMVRMRGIKFFDVWHGIPFKGFDGQDFRVQRRYEQAFVASPLMASVYRERFGFDRTRVTPTGYSRTDILVDMSVDPAEVRREIGVPENRKVILFAPTWRHDDPIRSSFPFGVDYREFLEQMEQIAVEHDATLVIRAHLNSRPENQRGSEVVRFLQFSDYPWTERLLLATDVLICDWSSIAFDFLILNRPAIFLDVPAPFAKGFTLGRAWRYGRVVQSMDTLKDAVSCATSDPERFIELYQARARAARTRLYGGMDDGSATDRCVNRIIDSLGA